MDTLTCKNGHTMTGIGGDCCPECEAPWVPPHTTPAIESNCDLMDDLMQKRADVIESYTHKVFEPPHTDWVEIEQCPNCGTVLRANGVALLTKDKNE